MEYLITGAIFGLCLFLVPIWSYKQGIKDGLNLSKGKDPEPIKTPIKMYKEHVETKQNKEKQSQFTSEINNLLAYDGKPQKEGDT